VRSPSLDNHFENHATEKLGDLGRHNLHGFRGHPKKTTAFD
jgi:hypothetical protein